MIKHNNDINDCIDKNINTKLANSVKGMVPQKYNNKYNRPIKNINSITELKTNNDFNKHNKELLKKTKNIKKLNLDVIKSKDWRKDLDGI